MIFNREKKSSRTFQDSEFCLAHDLMQNNEQILWANDLRVCV